jgi:hypothetical protein
MATNKISVAKTQLQTTQSSLETTLSFGSFLSFGKEWWQPFLATFVSLIERQTTWLGLLFNLLALGEDVSVPLAMLMQIDNVLEGRTDDKVKADVRKRWDLVIRDAKKMSASLHDIRDVTFTGATAIMKDSSDEDEGSPPPSQLSQIRRLDRPARPAAKVEESMSSSKSLKGKAVESKAKPRANLKALKDFDNTKHLWWLAKVSDLFLLKLTVNVRLIVRSLYP